MSNANKARKHNSLKFQELLDEVTPLEMEQTKIKMQLAARIEDFMKINGWSKSQFAEKVGKNPSEITKWFSGTQNFTVDILTEIALSLGVELIALLGNQQVKTLYKQEISIKTIAPPESIRLTTPYGSELDFFGLCFQASQNTKFSYLPLYQA